MMNTYFECRTCLESVAENSIINLETKIFDEKNLTQAIEEFADIQITEYDTLPKQICQSCFKTLESSIYFRNQIISSDEQLKKRLSTSVFINGEGSFSSSLPPAHNGFKNDVKSFKVEQFEKNENRNETEHLLEEEVDISLKEEIKGEDAEKSLKSNESRDSCSDQNDFGTNKSSSDEEFIEESLYKTLKKMPLRNKRSITRWKQVERQAQDTSDDSDSDIPLESLKRELKDLGSNVTSTRKRRKTKDTLDSPRLCPICGKLFKARQNFNSHMTTVHRKKPTKPEKISCLCPDCGRVISGTRQNFVAHRRYHHSDKAQVKKRFSCDICPKRFYREKNLVIHLRIHKGEKGYVCDLCPDKAYTQIGGLILHKRKVHLKKPSCTCNYCGKQFYEKHYLETHIRQWHTGERPFSCEICGKSFSCNGTLLRHRKDSHGEKQPCPKCGKMYTEGELRKHLKRHKIREEGIKRKKFTCDYCGTEMNFTSRKRHLLKQHGIMLRGRGETAERVPVNRPDAM